MRTALCLAALSLVSSAHAAPISLSAEPNHIQIQPVFVDVTDPTQFAAKSLDDNPLSPLGWLLLGQQNINPTTPPNPPPPHWVVSPFWIANSDGQWRWRPNFTNIRDHAVVDVSEFIAAGDTTLTLRIDSSRLHGPGPVPLDFHIITWESPNLGVVTRTYQRIPEPASAALLTLGAVLALRRRRR